MLLTNRMPTALCSFLLLSLSLICSSFARAQTLPRSAIQVTGGYSRNGSGDMNGISFGTDYIRYAKKRLSLDYYFRAAINNAEDDIWINDSNTGKETNSSLRFTTAGVQLGVNGGVSMVRNARHELMLSLGAFGRYQSASNGADGYSIYYPSPATGLPAVLIGYDNHTPQRTFAVGSLLQLHYNYTLKNNISIGFLPGFQTDTNGDAIIQMAFTVGKRW